MISTKKVESIKLGSGVCDRYSHLYCFGMTGAMQEICKLKKGFLPLALFEFGNMRFPASNDNKIYICPQSLCAKYGTYIVIE